MKDHSRNLYRFLRRNRDILLSLFFLFYIPVVLYELATNTHESIDLTIRVFFLIFSTFFGIGYLREYLRSRKHEKPL